MTDTSIRHIVRFLSARLDWLFGPRMAMNIAIAVTALRHTPLRFILTVTGVMVGTGSIILIAALGEGAKRDIAGTVKAMGSNMIIVSAVPDGGTGAQRGELALRDATVIARNVDYIRHIAPQLLYFSIIKGPDGIARTNVIGATPSLQDITGADMQAGRFLRPVDLDRKATVAVIGTSVARRLFGQTNPVGKNIRIDRTSFTVIGLLKERGRSLTGDPDDTVLVPLPTVAQRLRGRDLARPDAIDMLYVQFNDNVDLTQAQNALAQELRDIHRVEEDDIAPFTLISTEEFAKQSQSIILAIQIGLVAIAAISLFVGAIGITNIMLVSVSERTKEIGLRMAIGANPRDIRWQFLTEAALLCFVGGLAGLVIGSGLSHILNTIGGLQTYINPTFAFVTLVLAIIIGILAGTWPAIHAARMSPIDALRHD